MNDNAAKQEQIEPVDICVTMVNTNETALVKTCLTSLYKDSAGSGLTIAVVIVDNASADDIGPMLATEFPGVKLLRQTKNSGFGAAHNRALKEITAKYYFVLNPDTDFNAGEHLLRRLYDFMETHPRAAVAGPRIRYPDGSLQYSCYRFPTFWQPLFSRTKLGAKNWGKRIADYFTMKDFDHETIRPVDWIMGSAMFVRGAAIAEVGGFDDRFWMYAEDSDWCRRFWEKNWSVYYVPTATLIHIHGRASARVPGVVRALLTNRYARVHLTSWMKYFWKWRGNRIFYAGSK